MPHSMAVRPVSELSKSVKAHVVTAHNNDEQYMRSKRERSRERDTQI
jgi:hypothetical protein